MKQRIEQNKPLNLNDQLNAISMGLLPTPTAQDFKHRGPNSRQQGLADVVRHWPTPTAFDFNTSVKNRTEEGSKTYRHNLKEAVQRWPTPQANSGNGVGHHGEDSLDLQTAVSLFHTPTVKGNNNRRGASRKTGDGLATAARLWGTPTANDAKNSLTDSQVGRGTLTSHVVESLWPTPTSRDWKNATAKEWDDPKNTRNLNRRVAKLYEGSEARQERLGQLNPDWVEALMGYPQGWTDIDAEAAADADYPARWFDGTWEAGIPRVVSGVKNRVSRLKCLGNAVVPQIPKLLWELVAGALWA